MSALQSINSRTAQAYVTGSATKPFIALAGPELNKCHRELRYDFGGYFSVERTLADACSKADARVGDPRARALAKRTIEQFEAPHRRFELWMLLLNRTH